MQLAGLEAAQAEREIAVQSIRRGVYRRPLVTVTMKEPRVNKVTVVGAVNEPGVYELPRGASTLLAAIVQAGGLSEKAGSNVEIVRQAGNLPSPHTAREAGTFRTVSHTALTPTPQSIHVNLQSLAEEGGAGIPLAEGDVLEVETRDPQPVHVMGLVRKAGAFELPMYKEMRVLDALALAGERTVPWADKVVIVRHIPDRPEPVVIAVSIREAMHNGEANIRLAPGDVVSVEQSVATRTYDVMNFIRFGFGASGTLF
jgi:polysaccharide export outer membrane protein